jgi:hypothetical protein
MIAYLTIAVGMLLVSATPGELPTASIFWAWRSCSSSRFAP